MTEADFERRINELNTELLTTVASLSDLVVAQNFALMELTRLAISDHEERGDLTPLKGLNEALDEINAQSRDYVKVLRASIASLGEKIADEPDA